VKLCLNADKTGVICLGGGTPKHYALNAQLFRDGCDYAVYINTGSDYDGSDSGARPDEAISWGKIKAGGKSVKVTADATIAFPLIVAGAFSK
jgi:deoxyhypusine synthase